MTTLADKYVGQTPNTVKANFYPDLLEAAMLNGLTKNNLEVRLSLLDAYNMRYLSDDDDDGLDDVELTLDGLNYLIGVTRQPGVMTTSSDIGNAVITAKGPGGRKRKD